MHHSVIFPKTCPSVPSLYLCLSVSLRLAVFLIVCVFVCVCVSLSLSAGACGFSCEVDVNFSQHMQSCSLGP